MVAGDKLLGLLARARRWRDPSHSVYPSRRLEPGSMSPAPDVPPEIERPPYVADAASAVAPARATSVGALPELFADDPDGLERMRRAGAIAAAALSLAGRMIEAWPSSADGGVGISGSGSAEAAAAAATAPLTTDAIDRAVHAYLVSRGAYPSPLGYRGFPRSVCASVNECAAHGVPDGAPLRGGDLVSVDVSAHAGGVHGDTCATFFVGGVGGGGGGGEGAPRSSASARELVEAAREALYAAVRACGPGVPFCEVGRAAQRVADRRGMSVVRSLVGHGVGRVFHAAPAVPHHREWGARAAARGRMALGQAFTIEPVLTLGRAAGGRLAAPWPRDGWTLVTADGSLAAQFEHTLVVGEGGAEVLTRREGERIGGPAM